jgi:exopolysaccharide production protein ExoQ
MPPAVASGVFALLILGLFWLDRDQSSRTSGALWIAVVWWLLACSRSVGQWLQMGPPIDQLTADRMLEGSPIDLLVYSGLLVLGLLVLVKRGSQVLRLLQGNGAIIIFFLYCAVSILWSDYPEVAFKRWIKALGDLVMVLVVLSDREPSAAFVRLLARTTYLLVPCSVLLIKYYPDIGRSIHQWTYRTLYTGVSFNKNGLGAICLLCGLATVWRLLMAYQDRKGTARTRRLLAHGVILMMVLWLFWLTDSMTSLSCFIIGSAILLVGNLRAVIKNPVAVHLIIATILSVTISVLFFNVSHEVLNTIGRDPTLTDRTEVWALLISVSGSSLLGTGYESFWLGPRLEKIWSVYSWKPFSAHNGYLEVYLNLGCVGVALLAVVIVTGYRRVIAAFRNNPQIGSLMLAYFSVGVVYNCTEAAFFRMMAPVWMFILLAITGAMVLANRSVHIPVGEGLDHEKPPPSWSGVGVQHSDKGPSASQLS